MTKHLYHLLVFSFIIFSSCSEDDNITSQSNDASEDDDIVLTENIEFYDENTVENNLVFAIKNGGNSAFLLNKVGEKVKEWDFGNNYLGNDLEILPDGKLLGLFKTSNTNFSFGGQSGIVRIIDTDGSIFWEYTYSTENYIAHHDVEMLPNGNILFLAWERLTASDAQQLGIDTENDIFPETLVEINPTTNEIEWKWNSIDHIIQDEDSTLPNFGVISEKPNRINFNYNIPENGDIMHANGIDYDEENDIIFVSVNYFSEVWVIDHSTSTAEASSDSGGNYNKGGDLIYRFGNPEAYNNPFGERLFYNNHFPNFLEDDVPGAGNVLIYVNGVNIQQSSVYELKMPETLELIPNSNNEPQIVWSFTDSNLYYARISGADRLPNGNTLICEGNYGFWEITPSGEIAWKYKGDNNEQFWRGYGYNYDDPEILSLGIEF